METRVCYLNSLHLSQYQEVVLGMGCIYSDAIGFIFGLGGLSGAKDCEGGWARKNW